MLSTRIVPHPLVVVANREHSVRDWIHATVSSAGVEVRAVANASEALANVPADRATCAILDLQANIDCLESSLQLLRANVGVIFTTRERCIASCVRVIRAGAIDVLPIPCDTLELVGTLHRGLRESVVAWQAQKQLDDLRSRFQQLTARERETFELVCSGLLNKQVAQRLGISEITVQIHRGRVMRKMSAKSFAELVRMADALKLSPQSACFLRGATSYNAVTRCKAHA